MIESEERPGRGLAIAAMAVAAVSFVLAVSTWMAWLLVRPKLLSGAVYPIVTQVFLLVLGALWFVALLAGVLAVVFGLVGGARSRSGDLARGGALLGALTCLVALIGAVTFALSPTWAPLQLNYDPGSYSGQFGR
ncbi:hypothetical protein [Amycolatopsis jejuensis]|uniref:hypothetical protein n=1 Tax=Amycolatopsis jejuensis TaxID=330084 RepID=UPI00068CB075|nr:hypothetical protein [Amycolatopsis jejuensis]